jgi:hypothetical protein
MSAADPLSLLATAQQTINALQARLATRRGTRHALAMEISQNLELLRLGLHLQAQPCEVIDQLQDSAYRQALAAGYRFNRLNRSRIASRSTANTPALRRYHGWSTERLVDNIYHKIKQLKQLCALPSVSHSVDLDARLRNLFRLMAVLAIHVGSNKE